MAAFQENFIYESKADLFADPCSISLLNFCLLCSISYWEKLLKSPTVNVDLSFFPLAHQVLLHVFWSCVTRALTFRIFMFFFFLSFKTFVIMKYFFKFLVIVLVLKSTSYDINIITSFFKKYVWVLCIYISILLLSSIGGLYILKWLLIEGLALAFLPNLTTITF